MWSSHTHIIMSVKSVNEVRGGCRFLPYILQHSVERKVSQNYALEMSVNSKKIMHTCLISIISQRNQTNSSSCH